MIRLILIILIVLGLLFWWCRDRVEHLGFPNYPLNVNPQFANGEESYNYGAGKPWYKPAQSDGVEYDLLKYREVDPSLIILPKQLNNTNRVYNMGFINIDDDFKKRIITEGYDDFIDIDKLESVNINTLTGKELDADGMMLFLRKMNLPTWKNRWKEYNPNKDFSLENKYIESQIPDINVLNRYIINRINIAQNGILTPQEILTFGRSNLVNLIYMISDVEMDRDMYVYSVHMVLFRDNIQYAPIVFYKGFVKDGKPYVALITLVGYFTTDKLLMPDKIEIDKYMDLANLYRLNKYYRSSDHGRETDLLKTVYARNKYLNSFKIKNQFACFSSNINDYLNPRVTTNTVLNSNNRSDCQSRYDAFGRVKIPGIWDKPCDKNSDCQFYGANKNYPNEYGKCKPNGYCELPVNMINMGYRYFITTDTQEPMCYNCKSKKWNSFTELGNCCWEQNDRKKYPFLKSPDFAFKNDLNSRINYSYSENCYRNVDGRLVCDN